MTGVAFTNLSTTTAPFEPTAMSGRLSWLRSEDNWLIDIPKNLSPEATSEPAILYVIPSILVNQMEICIDFKYSENTRPYILHVSLLAHLWVRKADFSLSLAMEYVDAALTVILQRCSNCQITEGICVKIRQYSKRGAKPSFVRHAPSQY